MYTYTQMQANISWLDITTTDQGGAGQHHMRALFADSAILCNTNHLVLPVVCD